MAGQKALFSPKEDEIKYINNNNATKIVSGSSYEHIIFLNIFEYSSPNLIIRKLTKYTNIFFILIGVDLTQSVGELYDILFQSYQLAYNESIVLNIWNWNITFLFPFNQVISSLLMRSTLDSVLIPVLNKKRQQHFTREIEEANKTRQTPLLFTEFHIENLFHDINTIDHTVKIQIKKSETISDRNILSGYNVQLNSFENICLGGTFDHFHMGHKLFFSTATLLTSYSKKSIIYIGVTTDALLLKKEYANILDDYEKRSYQVKDFLSVLRPDLFHNNHTRIVIEPISDSLGLTIKVKNLDVMVVSDETLSGIDIY